MQPRLVGQTKSAGFQVGVRRTFPVSLDDAWRFLTSERGVDIWLGEPLSLRFVVGETFTTTDGTTGTIRVVNPRVNIRLTWQPPEWQQPSTIQVRTIANGEQTTISFHQEQLAGARERAHMQQHWQRVLETFQTLFAERAPVE